MWDLITIVLVLIMFALILRRWRMFNLLPWQGPHDMDTWVPDFILDRLDR
jgi:hypothetical protein